uniref:Uncharacterized protein n=1 Tax=Tanacetum cinerariifolium TaxID=118510 RepID=A0A6L2LFH5_TANCI|nr:hypothetical protein [Tanacetum cinerariifolium]
MDPHLKTRRSNDLGGACTTREKESKAKKLMIGKSKQLRKQRAIAYMRVDKLFAEVSITLDGRVGGAPSIPGVIGVPMIWYLYGSSSRQ